MTQGLVAVSDRLLDRVIDALPAASGVTLTSTTGATLEAMDGTPVTRANGTVGTSESYDLWIDLAVTPSYVDMERAASRTFA